MDIQEALTKAKLAAARGDNAAARSMLAQAAKHDPTNEQVYLLLAEVAEDREQVIQALDHVLKLNPNNQIALRSLARLHREGEPFAAEQPRPRGNQQSAAILGRLPRFLRKQFTGRPAGLLLAAAALAVFLTCAFALLCTLAGTSLKAVQDPFASRTSTITTTIAAAEGDELSLSDGASLVIPAGALPADTEITFANLGDSDSSVPQFEYAYGVGSLYEVDLGPGALRQPVTLEIPFDPESLPQGAEPSQVFLSYFDDRVGEWRFAGGTVEVEQSVVRISTDHASVWRPSTWNWRAWTAALHKITQGSIVGAIEGIDLFFFDECPQQGQVVQVDADPSHSLLQGCVAEDDPVRPVLRVVNPKAFFVEVQTESEGNSYFEQTMLGPGEDLRFTANTQDPSPLIVSAEMTQKAGFYLVIDMVVAMLPGANQLGFQGKTIACLTERLSDSSYFFSAANSLALSHDALAASESISRFMLDEDTVLRFIQAAGDCDYGPAPTWSIEGFKQIASSVSVITSAADFIVNYLSGNQYSSLAFAWTQESTVVSGSSGGLELQLLQACLDEGYVCMPLPFEIAGPVDWLRGVTYDPAWEGEEGPAQEYLGLNPALGTLIIAPFDGFLSNLAQWGFNLTVELPSAERLKLRFYFAGYHEFAILAQDATNVSAGDPIARYERVVQWDPSGAVVGPDFEYPGIVQVSTGYGVESPNGLPVYPVVKWDPQVNFDPQRDVEQLMVSNDCRRITYQNSEMPTAIFDTVIDLLHRSGIEVDPEPTGYMDLSPPLALWPPEVSLGRANTEIADEGDTRYFRECVYMQVWDLPFEYSDTIVYESTAEGGRWKFANPLKRFIVWSDEG